MPAPRPGARRGPFRAAGLASRAAVAQPRSAAVGVRDDFHGRGFRDLPIGSSIPGLEPAKGAVHSQQPPFRIVRELPGQSYPFLHAAPAKSRRRWRNASSSGTSAPDFRRMRRL